MMRMAPSKKSDLEFGSTISTYLKGEYCQIKEPESVTPAPLLSKQPARILPENTIKSSLFITHIGASVLGLFP
jgi:hypothetical protein